MKQLTFLPLLALLAVCACSSHHSHSHANDGQSRDGYADNGDARRHKQQMKQDRENQQGRRDSDEHDWWDSLWKRND